MALQVINDVPYNTNFCLEDEESLGKPRGIMQENLFRISALRGCVRFDLEYLFNVC